MPLIVGLFLIPLVLVIIRASNFLRTKKINRVLLNILLIIISIIYIAFCWLTRAEPFDFEEHYSAAYMFYRGKYILDTAIIFVFTPFMWIIVIHFAKMFLHSFRIRKNAMIKKSEDYIYYRGDLDKISPSIIMFTSHYELDLRKSISATILKLKLTGYLKGKSGQYIVTDKKASQLLESEKMVLAFIKEHDFDKSSYKSVVEKETLQGKYLTKRHGGVILRITKIIIACCIPIAMFVFSFRLDQYVFNNYRVYPENDGYTYIILGNDKEIEKLYFEDMIDEEDYYHRSMADGSLSYNHSEIRADKLKYAVIRKALFLSIFNSLAIGFCFVSILISLYVIVEQIRNFNKNYRRTRRGRILLNKAYALKNYLKEYSLIKDRTEKELVLWQYYLIYAVALEVNSKIEDDIIEKYTKTDL